MDTMLNYRIKKMSPQFIVTDLETSVKFYTQQLGFDIDFRYEDFYAGVIKDACSVHLKLGNPYVGERQGKRDNEHLDITFSVNNIEDLYKEFANSSVEVVQPLRNMPYGKEFYIADPDGYIMAFLEEA